jgi:hypothetical protein
MKKALFKPTSKIGENFEISKFQEMILKKIHFFYKTYIRHLKKINNINDNSRVYELIKKDVEEYNLKKDKDRYALNTENLSDNQFEDMDIKNLMIVDFFRSLGGRNPFLKSSMQTEKMELYLNNEKEDEDAGNKINVEVVESKEENLMEDYLTFNELSLKDKVDILLFFCNYALTFSGRASFFHEEITKDAKDPANSHLNYKRIKLLGKDNEENTYYALLCNKDCRVYKETEDYGVQVVVKNYEELEKFISKLEETNDHPLTKELIKSIKDNLLLFKENSEEEAKRDANFLRKQQAFEKAKKLSSIKQGSSEIEKYTNNDYFLMNISDHVITRHQLNQITRSSIQNQGMMNSLVKESKPNVVTEDERKKIKIEKEKIERQKRLEKRNRILERQYQFENESLNESVEKNLDKDYLKSKRDRGGVRNSHRHKDQNSNQNNRNLKPRKKRGDESEEEFLSDSFSRNSHSQENLHLESDREDDENYIQMENNFNPNPGEPNDIILEGNLIYRYSNNQIELDGQWYMSTDQGTREKLSYLFQKTSEYLDCQIKNDEILESNDGKDFAIKICCANVFECITINKQQIFEKVLEFLSGEFAGYFMYYGKTIEDRADISLELEDSLVRINGKNF